MQLKRNEILTGLLVVATLAVLTGVLILLGAPGLFRPLVTYRIYFDVVGTTVRILHIRHGARKEPRRRELFG